MVGQVWYEYKVFQLLRVKYGKTSMVSKYDVPIHSVNMVAFEKGRVIIEGNIVLLFVCFIDFFFIFFCLFFFCQYAYSLIREANLFSL